MKKKIVYLFALALCLIGIFVAPKSVSANPEEIDALYDPYYVHGSIKTTMNQVALKPGSSSKIMLQVEKNNEYQTFFTTQVSTKFSRLASWKIEVDSEIVKHSYTMGYELLTENTLLSNQDHKRFQNTASDIKDISSVGSKYITLTLTNLSDQTEIFNFGVRAAEFREYYYGYGTTQILRFDFPSTWFNY